MTSPLPYYPDGAPMPIRPYRDADYPAILDIYARSKLDELRHEARRFTLVPLDQDEERLASFRESDVVVFETDRILGYAASHGAQIRALFVHPDARGTGVGRALLEHSLAHPPAPQTLSVASSNHPAKALYQYHGFRVSGEFLAHYHGQPVIANTMRRDPPPRPDQAHWLAAAPDLIFWLVLLAGGGLAAAWLLIGSGALLALLPLLTLLAYRWRPRRQALHDESPSP